MERATSACMLDAVLLRRPASGSSGSGHVTRAHRAYRRGMSGNGTPGPGRLIFGDATIVFLLLNEVRHRVMARLFGVSRKDSNIVTAVAVAVTAAGAQRRRRAAA